MITIIEMTSGEEILEEHTFIEVKMFEVDKEVTIEMKTFEDVEVGLEKDSIQVILQEIIKAVVDQDKFWKQVLIEIGSDFLSVGSMIILLKTVQIYQIQKKNSQNRYNKCLI